ncbi:MAG: uracil-DNA glycosylase family protein, partial [Bacteroidota bacterium]
MKNDLPSLLKEIRACRYCEAHLPLGPRPVLAAQASARIIIAGQAPGTRVHATGVPWNDPSGERLRSWLDMDKDTFYDDSQIAIIPMGFCYPGKGERGDLPPRPECAELWQEKLLSRLPHIKL